VKKIGVVGINVPPGTSTTDVLAAGAKKLGWEITRIDYDQRTTLDFAPIVSRLASANVDLVTGYQNPNDAILFAKAVAQQSWRPKQGFVWVAGGHYLTSFAQSVGPAADRWLDASYSGPIAQQKAYSAALRTLAARFATQAEQPLLGLAGAGPAIITVLAAGLEKAKSTDPEKLRDALATVRFKSAKDAPFPYYSMAGGVRFNANGDNIAWRPTFVQLSSAGGQRAVFPTQVATGKLAWPAK
jgi:branched-chain amino acid transport system substrate-binding protein